jgi:glutamine synthetase
MPVKSEKADAKHGAKGPMDEKARRAEAMKKANGILESNKLRWMQVQFSDLFGGLKTFTVPVEDLLSGKIWNEGIGVDGSSVKGFAHVEASDLRVIPDPSTIALMPAIDNPVPMARAIGDVFDPRSGERFDGDPRNVARRAMQDLHAAGFDESGLSPELEFTVFRSMSDMMLQNDIWNSQSVLGSGHLKVIPEMMGTAWQPNYVQKPGRSYMVPAPADDTDAYRTELAGALQDMKVPVKFAHHENGIGQQEIEIKAMPCAVRMGDACQTYKHLARIIARKHGFVATFMPKPIHADSGNGMHVHISLWKNGENRFYDKDARYNMSQTMRYFVGGLLDHARGTAAITNPTVNSYKRLVPEYEAPVFIAWSPINRTALIRIPARYGNPKSINCEPRHADPSANPYLVFAAYIQSGLDGIKKKLEPGDPVNENIFHLSAERMKALGIGRLPASLGEALEEMQSDDISKKTLGKHCFDAYLELKKKEWHTFSTQVSTWEHSMYLDV